MILFTFTLTDSIWSSYDVLFQILRKSRCHILVIFSSHLKIVIFYARILTRKVVLWCFLLVNRVKKSAIQLFVSKRQYMFSAEHNNYILHKCKRKLEILLVLFYIV